MLKRKVIKYKKELANDVCLTNSLKVKKNKNGKVKKLSKTDIAYKKGYLSACKDNANEYLAKCNKVRRKLC